MTHYRSQIRAAIKLAITVSPLFPGITLQSAWAQNVDAASLPVIGVATPRENKDQETLVSADRVVTAIVVLKRLGGDDLEDALDIDSIHVEAVALAAIRTLGFGAQLDSTDIEIGGSAEQRVGSLTMAFRAILQTPEPLTL